jgi:hypothetical protein
MVREAFSAVSSGKRNNQPTLITTFTTLRKAQCEEHQEPGAGESLCSHLSSICTALSCVPPMIVLVCSEVDENETVKLAGTGLWAER